MAALLTIMVQTGSTEKCRGRATPGRKEQESSCDHFRIGTVTY